MANESQKAVMGRANENAPVKMVFRTYPNGDVLALMPEEPASYDGLFCMSYLHVEQLGVADYALCVRQTRPATPAERVLLKRELRRMGYKMVTLERAPVGAREARLRQLATNLNPQGE
jgi:hypothetical protein